MYRIIQIDSKGRDTTIRKCDSYDLADKFLQSIANHSRRHGYTIIPDVDRITTVSPHGYWQQYRIEY